MHETGTRHPLLPLRAANPQVAGDEGPVLALRDPVWSLTGHFRFPAGLAVAWDARNRHSAPTPAASRGESAGRGRRATGSGASGSGCDFAGRFGSRCGRLGPGCLKSTLGVLISAAPPRITEVTETRSLENAYRHPGSGSDRRAPQAARRPPTIHRNDSGPLGEPARRTRPHPTRVLHPNRARKPHARRPRSLADPLDPDHLALAGRWSAAEPSFPAFAPDGAKRRRNLAISSNRPRPPHHPHHPDPDRRWSAAEPQRTAPPPLRPGSTPHPCSEAPRPVADPGPPPPRRPRIAGSHPLSLDPPRH
ncbi:hypothetical protein EHYA_05182 [Embleya hyalina]|uniref:Uncharacterized protein n=1 Tax=Embleya hyalina TaxID=516124 RepID=A0A401YSA6_9ACTN|nr:hypothetical protein EHYA_05182 [Embleya hyalina]